MRKEKKHIFSFFFLNSKLARVCLFFIRFLFLSPLRPWSPAVRHLPQPPHSRLVLHLDLLLWVQGRVVESSFVEMSSLRLAASALARQVLAPQVRQENHGENGQVNFVGKWRVYRHACMAVRK